MAALVSSFLGVFIVLKRIVFVSAALSQVSALGIAISILAGIFFGIHFGEGEQSGFISIPAVVSFLFATAALLLSDHIRRVFWLATVFGIISALVGFYLSFVYSLPTGSAMLATSAFFLLPGIGKRFFVH
ncbi:MAG: metal ABC transporter permease [Nitrospirae bacterium]|nr:metal ABC transporter permease [Nitrospirota bacterium]